MIQSKFHLSDPASPLLALAIHNGHRLPEGLLPYTEISAEDRFREEDPHTGSIAQHYANHIVLETSRFAVDLNRRPDKAVYQNPEDAWGLTVRNGVVPHSLLAGLRYSYQSWYATLQYQIDRMLCQHPVVVVLDLHSYNHRRGGPDAEPDPQEKNPDIILGRSNMSEDYYPLIEDLRLRLDGQDLAGRSLDVRCDVKFPGGQLPRFLNERYDGKVICVAVEFKKIFMDEHSGVLNPALLRFLSQIFLKHSLAWVNENLKITTAR
ncbi:MAG: N-formylglutamate amidohydrolase [Candidatus Cloacimonetes bacterium]|jgi:hypothetical protein|nr:N-formylglutamate amidohydrolase [Candidatus Cloacimonadota bacterium]MDD2423548.1 N-formylglutamate amidohydrolase [Candidatus Cloacimonadota bacterium]MDD3562073.1 N-formylglutamate amidohydrolase [Candidatus Cloacimonadota bacterium]MDD4277050.1 N-formylglutamate amidohydrolase [Candidatus Cloacimonadota bacterium]MDY0324999.1 N-formylglutamate amidohydrolase [Candidatus Cloacimonadaceae bacterium]